MFLKRILATVSAITVLACSIFIVDANNEYIKSGKCGENANWSLDTETGTLTISGTGEMYTDKSVYEWGYYPYRNEIKEVIVEEGITSISDFAFGLYGVYDRGSAYPNLANLTLHSSLKSIGRYAFYDSGLISFKLPEGLETIEDGAFAETSLSDDLILPKTLKNVGSFAFSRTDIISVNLNEGMHLGGQSFKSCNSLKEVTIPKDIDFLTTPASNAMLENAAFFIVNH